MQRIGFIFKKKQISPCRVAMFMQVMGILIGKITGPTMIVTDVFALPVTGTEVECARNC
jgi:hypothetical protein